VSASDQPRSQGEAQTAERHRLVPLARGRVLEIGFGSGLNLPFDGPAVQRLTAAAPSVELWRLAEKRVARMAFAVEFREASAERLPFEDGVFESAVMTWTLCSIPDPARALREVRRVLVPEGRPIFVEHGRAPDDRVRAWQDRLTPWWRRVAGGCELNRDIPGLLKAAGVRVVQSEEKYGEAHDRSATSTGAWLTR
jgi:ubiquinone/menaquinone biosynthesis C-methylase UbiE